MNPFTQYKPWMIERYGEALFRIPVEIAGSCPHGRCAFCSENGSRAQQTQQQESPFEQAEEAIRFARRRYRAKKFMLYIQAFTADLTNPKQQQVILDLLAKFDFEAISIGTRPDCLPPEALAFLTELKTRILTLHEVWVELGVQTANDETLKTIHRGHDWACSKQAILDLAYHGILVAPHVILGLPDETSNDWKNTATELAQLPISGIKIHNLHVMKGTALAENPPPTLCHWEYAEGLIDFMRRIPADIPVMRISTDTPDDQLIAPHWHLEKGQFLDYVIQQMTCRQIAQGDLTDTRHSTPDTQLTPVPTADGSVTFFSEDWKEHYHTKAGARLEAQHKFIVPSRLTEKLKTRDVKLLDVCFGLGNNSLAALCEQRRTSFQLVCPRKDAEPRQTGKMPVPHSLDITALEMDKRIVRAAAEHFQSLETDPVDWNETLQKLLNGSVEFPTLGNLDLQFGDARYLIQIIEDKIFDFIFHDPFSTQHCPELWTVEFFQQLHRVMKPDGVLLTYSSAAPVRGAMREAGFCIAETVPGHQMGNGTIASPAPLPEMFPTIGNMDERRSIPYRDEFLCATSKAILRQRQEVVEAFY
jgi:radical SAM protein (TIGR01212 family)